MAGWDGSGNFTVPYNFVADAAAGIKILASKQDTQWGVVCTGLMNTLTRDGQTTPTANTPWNNKKITGLAPGTAGTDAVNVSQLAPSTWIGETFGLSFVNTTQFKVLATDATLRYTVGRRVKATVTGPPTTGYYTVSGSTFSAPDTTVTLVRDVYAATSPNLDAGLSAIFYGIELYDLGALPKRTDVTFTPGVAAGMGASGAYGSNLTGAVPTFVQNDTMSEVNTTTSRFTAKVAGYYMISLRFTVAVAVGNTGTTNGTVALGSKLSGGAASTVFQFPWAYAASQNLTYMVQVQYGQQMAANDFLDWVAQMVYAGPPPSASVSFVNIRRIS